MNWYLLVKYFHILSVIMMIGGMFARQLVRRMAKNQADVRLVAPLTHLAGRLDRLMVIPGSNATLVFGVVLALIGRQPIFGFLQGSSANWLLAANILLVCVLVIVFSVFVPHNKKLAVILQGALAAGQITAELRAALDDPRLALAHHFEEAATLVITALMVFNPFNSMDKDRSAYAWR